MTIDKRDASQPASARCAAETIGSGAERLVEQARLGHSQRRGKQPVQQPDRDCERQIRWPECEQQRSERQAGVNPIDGVLETGFVARRAPVLSVFLADKIRNLPGQMMGSLQIRAAAAGGNQLIAVPDFHNGCS